MRPVHRVEIVIEARHAEDVLVILERHALGGWSRIRDVGGFGERGRRRADDPLGGPAGNHLLITTCEPERLDALVEDIRPLLDRFGGMCLVSDARWVLHGGDPREG